MLLAPIGTKIIFQKSFDYENNRNKTMPHPYNSPAALRLESRQEEPYEMSVPQRQNPL